MEKCWILNEILLSLCILMNKNEITKSITFVLENLLHFVEELHNAEVQ